mgnify:CR=1 FL=1
MNTPTKKTQIRRTPKQWQHLITAFESSQDTVNTFCQKNHINPSSFYLWRSKLTSSAMTDKTDSPVFVPLQTLPERTIDEAQWYFELKLGNRMSLRFRKS